MADTQEQMQVFGEVLTLLNTVTPQPLYNTIVGIKAKFRVSYPIPVIMRVKCIDI